MARQYGSINLGQGFPGWCPPDFVIKASVAASEGTFEVHQYAAPQGMPRLVQALCKLYSPLIERELQPSNVHISIGASGALWLISQALLEPGDHALVISPYFDIYEGDIVSRGAKIVEVPLNMPPGVKSTAEYKLDMKALREAVTKKEAKLFFLNTPHNPTGKMFSKEELQEIAEIVKLNDRLIVITDEVYEFITFDNVKFERFCTLPGMWDRTINISSGGKFFSTTGWKVGWIYGPEELVKPSRTVANFVSFSVSHHHQYATALALEHIMKEDLKYINELKDHYNVLRQFMYETLEEIGLHPVKPQGTFFIDCDISGIELEKDQGTQKSITNQNFDKKDWNFCRWLTTEIGTFVDG
uniref:Aminotransferase class I/classII large domain-containing protein n=1 Tax=Arcella intermedia TaxID=1963864 RepID=A0A6B2L7S1_9EUKA